MPPAKATQCIADSHLTRALARTDSEVQGWMGRRVGESGGGVVSGRRRAVEVWVGGGGCAVRGGALFTGDHT